MEAKHLSLLSSCVIHNAHDCVVPSEATEAFCGRLDSAAAATVEPSPAGPGLSELLATERSLDPPVCGCAGASAPGSMPLECGTRSGCASMAAPSTEAVSKFV